MQIASRFVSFLRPAFEALCLNEFEGARIEITYEGFTVNISGAVILDQLGVDADAWVLDMATLGAWVVLFLLMVIATVVAGVQ